MMNNELYCYPEVKEKLRLAIQRSYAFQMKKAATCYDNAIILPALYVNEWNAVGGCLDNHGEFIWQSAVKDFMGYPYTYETEKAITVNQTYIYIGYMYNCYGHMLGDCLRWLWFIETQECKSLLEEGAKFVCVSIEPLQQYQLDLLKLAGVGDIIRVDKVTRVKKLYVPNQSIYTEKEQNYYSDIFNETIDSIIKNAVGQVKSQFPSKIYLTRRGWKSDIYGERNVEKYFKKQGYTIMSPEKYSIAEQIVMMNSASEIAATESSLSHSMIFCRPRTKCYILRKNLHINKYSLFINQMRELDVSFIDCSLSLFVDGNRWWDGPFFIYPNDNIATCFTQTHTHEREQRLPKFEFAKYLLYSIFYASNIADRLTNINHVYAKILQDELYKCPPLRLRSPKKIIKRLINKITKV